MAPLCKGSCRRSGLSGCFSLRLRTVMTLRDIPVFRSAYSASRNARAPAAPRPSVGGGSFALPLLRTEMLLRNIPVFRSAFFSKRPCYGLFSKTLDLQVRFARPPSAHRTSSSSCSGVPHGLFMISHHRPCGRWCFARLIRQAETLELQLHSQPPSKRTALSELKRSCFRFMLQVRSAHPPMPHRNDPSGHSGVPLGLFGKPKRSSSSRFAAFGGRGELRSPLHPPLPPPRILERQTGTPFGLYSAKEASLPSQRLRGCPPSPPPSFVLS